jgi:hypothetical protein
MTNLTASKSSTAQWIRLRLTAYVPADYLAGLTDDELLELRAMSKTVKKEKAQAYESVKDSAIDFLRKHKKTAK